MVPEKDEPMVMPGIDDTPTLTEQAKANGWHADVFSFNKAEENNVSFFNPGLVERNDGLWLMVRRAVFEHALDFGKNTIWACQLNPDMTPHGGKILEFPHSNGPLEQFEDARCVTVGDKVLVSACNFIWYGNGEWTGAHQTLAEFGIDYTDPDKDWTPLNRYDLEIDGNGRSVHDRTKHQKNWSYFVHDKILHLHYATKPWTIMAFDRKSMGEWSTYTGNGPQWAYGELRGGTPPVRVGDLFWSFNHSSTAWTGRYRKYFMGAVAFEAKPPFKPVLYTPEPLLRGSQNDYWKDRKPLVVFPGGAVIRDGVWTVVYGINDLKCGYANIPHEDLVKRCEPIPETFNPLMPTFKTKPSKNILREDDVARVMAKFTSPLVKARIMKVLKNAPIVRAENDSMASVKHG